MLTVTIPENELWDPIKEEFITIKKTTITLEHSLVSISKWESKWNKPFLYSKGKTSEELFDYIRCMTLTQNVSLEIYKYIPQTVIDKIIEYIDSPMTATWFSKQKDSGSREIITSEIIYYWMISLNIPFECQRWHLNRLLTLIKVCNIKNNPKEKVSKKELLSRNASLNAARKKQLNTKG